MTTEKNYKAKILYAEDDITLTFVTKDNLERRGYKLICCEDGKIAFDTFKKETFDLCILDIMLPKMDGFTLAKSIREINQDVPIIFLTAKSLLDDKITGLRLGADDYITKPFSIEELILKIEIFLKRSHILSKDELTETFFTIGKYQFDYKNLSLTIGNNKQQLTQKEADLLRLFCSNINQLIPREKILKSVWGDDDFYLGRSLDVFISRLRKYLSIDTSITIENVHGIGFKLSIEKN